MRELQTLLGTDIPLDTRGVLYLCQFNREDNALLVVREVFFTSTFEALQAYANIPNPESQLTGGNTYDDLITNLHILHERMANPEWLTQLAEQI